MNWAGLLDDIFTDQKSIEAIVVECADVGGTSETTLFLRPSDVCAFEYATNVRVLPYKFDITMSKSITFVKISSIRPVEHAVRQPYLSTDLCARLMKLDQKHVC